MVRWSLPFKFRVKMNYLNETLDDLNARLPELEWKLGCLNPVISYHSLPKGLFQPRMELSSSACIAEIKLDIQALTQQDNERSARYLANRVKQKINVLVSLCQIAARREKPAEKVHFGIKTLSTRQQWIQNMESDIATLSLQHQAIANTLAQMTSSNKTSAILGVQAELGEVERRLTLALESLKQATS